MPCETCKYCEENPNMSLLKFSCSHPIAQDSTSYMGFKNRRSFECNYFNEDKAQKSLKPSILHFISLYKLSAGSHPDSTEASATFAFFIQFYFGGDLVDVEGRTYLEVQGNIYGINGIIKR